MTGFLDALARQNREETLHDGIKALVGMYYDEYSDATAIDPSDLDVFRRLETLITEIGTTVFDMEDAIKEAEAEYRRDSRRQVNTFPDDDD